ncbi:MAG: bifunctional diaminohydroxyphosphoribosylaminopyrimidine deaminase/5-amino-6-(5-phosphoribosylamino)uracil reductase RibD [Phocaeicola sp.]
MTIEEKYMARCVQLAKNGLENVSPNPMVGAVIVCDGRIIGEGFHVRCGEGHAEVNAIASVKDVELLKRATIYVSLEPCSHVGKTPPCADLIIKKQIPRVVIGCLDPFFLVAGKGVEKLRMAGVEVVVGVLEESCKELISSFVVQHTLHRPFITLKWAQTANGYMDVTRESGKPLLLSTPLTQAVVHKRRAQHDAILVGRKTALLDDPSLTTRSWYGENPIRLVLDRKLKLPLSLRLFDGSVPTIVCNELKTEVGKNLEYVKFDFSDNFLSKLMSFLYERKIQSLLVEGGSHLLHTLISEGLWDEAFIEYAPFSISSGVLAPSFAKMDSLETLCLFGRNIIFLKNDYK